MEEVNRPSHGGGGGNSFRSHPILPHAAYLHPQIWDGVSNASVQYGLSQFA